MNMKKTSKILLIGVLSVVSLTSCKNGENTGFDNENDALVFSSQECDKVFNPFFSTSAADSNVINLTQIGMLGNSKNGKNATYGDSEPVVCYDLQTVTEGEGESQTTTYYFVLKNNVKFSNGSPLTIKDVLFNYYVYLDPVYTGSSTIYSTDIVGLKEYRTQEADEKEQESFALQFEIQAETRINALAECCDLIIDEFGTLVTKEKFRAELEKYTASSSSYSHVVEDYDKALELFKTELENDYTNSMDTYEEIIFSGESGKIYKNLFTTDVEAFLYNEGYISWNKKQEKLTSSFTNDLDSIKSMTKEKAIDLVFEDKVPTSVSEIITYWATASELYQYIVNKAMEEYYKGATRKFKNISGIKFANQKEPVVVNGKTYGVPHYNTDGSVVDSDNEVLSITIKKIDPKAIWNFSIGVAPMYYYSDAEHIAKFDFEENFGVEYASQTFMDTVIKNNDKIGVPVGAGPYAASKSSGGIENISAGEFYDKGIIYYERNPHYVMGAPIIKKIRYKVVAANQMTNALYTSDIDFVEPNSKPEIEAELEKHKPDIGYTTIDTAGYGYIGINAGKVPSLKVRQAIMHSINTLTTVEYYKTEASAIYRSMSKVSWAYPEGCTPYYPYVGSPVPEDLSVVNPDYAAYVTELGLHTGDVMTEKQQQEFLKKLIEDAGYTIGNGTYTKGSGDTLKYTFTIAGEETDHPAYSAMEDAGNLLNKIGCEITVTTDAKALKKLSNGSLAVWAAAWGSTIDPDMYQVYHKDSTATSTKNWGYDQIKANLGGKYDVELALVEDLSTLIEEARETNVESQRARIYSDALDLVMQLAVELPTYQRKDLYAYNAKKIDVSTLNQNPSTYDGLTSNLHTVSLLTK